MSKIKDQMIDEKIAKSNEPVPEYKFIDENKEHLHTYLGKPLLGTSTVVNVLAKPLTWWAAGLAVEKLGWINSKKKINGRYITTSLETRVKTVSPYLTKIKGMNEEQFIDLLDAAYKAHSVKLTDSASSGTDLHAELERFVKDHMRGMLGTYDTKIQPFIDWTMVNVKSFLWSEMHCYSEKLWCGGVSDVGVELNDGKIGIIDFKSSKDSYDSQFIQIAGYDTQISENGGYTKNGEKVFGLLKPLEFYAVVPFGAEKFTVDFRYNVNELKEAFECTVFLYKLLNK